jgi:hypothetical protein
MALVTPCTWNNRQPSDENLAVQANKHATLLVFAISVYDIPISELTHYKFSALRWLSI